MSAIASVSRNVTMSAVVTSVPDDDIARLMYYLHCVTVGLGLDLFDKEDEDLVDFQNHHLLTMSRRIAVHNTALLLAPSKLDGKLIFKDDEGVIVDGTTANKFVTVTTACNLVSVQRDFALGGQVKEVTKVMFYNTRWINANYNMPMERIDEFLHPRVGPATCTIQTIPNPPEAIAQAVQHRAICDGCTWQFFTGPRFKCNVCADYDLCVNCYKAANAHLDTGHDFRRYESPEDSPVYLPVRTRPESTVPLMGPSAPPPPYMEETERLTAAALLPTRSAPASTSAADLAPTSPRDVTAPPTAQPTATAAANAFFYLSMSINELKKFLVEHEVEPEGGNSLDQEALCKLAWEVHVECMSLSEVNTFLAANDISTADCRNISAKRAKAKNAFRPPPKPPVSVTWKKDDEVVFVALSKKEMNGKRGVVQSVDIAVGKVTVWVEDLGKSFKLKFENVEPWVEELGADLADEPEDLE